MNEQALRQQARIGGVVADYIQLAKPGIVGLTLVAALTGIFFGNDGVMPNWGAIVWTFVTLGLATAGSCMLNNVYDQDIDRIMERTSSRPLAAGAVSPVCALIVGVLLVILPIGLMAITVNMMAALLTAAAAFGYVVVYTMLTKRHTPWANQLGGIAGALPPAIGYVAITGVLDMNAVILFAIMVVWQQPHALSIAMKYRKEYAKAGVPVVPVAKGVHATKQRILIYTLALLPTSVLPYFYGMAGSYYLVAAIALGAIFIAMAVRFLWDERDRDMRLFAYSLVYLIALFFAMLADAQHGVVI